LILIAHRGLRNGPNKNKENNPDNIRETILAGFDVEIDVWIKDEALFLGHDEPQYEINREFFELSGLWIHAKNLEALLWLTTTDYNYFWHQTDDYTITSKGYIWTYPGKKLTNFSISVMPEWEEKDYDKIKQYQCAGICSDYVSRLKND